MRRHRLSFPEAAGCDRVRRNSLLDQIIAHRLGPAFRKLSMVFVAAHAVGMPFHRQMQARIRQHNAETLARRSRAAVSRSKLPLLNHTSDIFAIKPGAESRVESTVLSCCKRRVRNSCFSFSACRRADQIVPPPAAPCPLPQPKPAAERWPPGWPARLPTRLETYPLAQELRNGAPWRLVAGSTFVIFGIDHKASSHALAFTLRVQVGFIAQSQVDNASLPR
jgi:hypothetical protein